VAGRGWGRTSGKRVPSYLGKAERVCPKVRSMGAVRAVELPTGVVTLLFTDIEGSTRLLQELENVYGDVLAEHHRLLRRTWAAHHGTEVDTEGDGFFVAFASVSAAVTAAAAAQQALADHAWPHGRPVRVRMALHTGEPRVHDSTYWGIDVHYAARLCSAAHGGQVLLSAATRALVPDADVDDLGSTPSRTSPRREPSSTSSSGGFAAPTFPRRGRWRTPGPICPRSPPRCWAGTPSWPISPAASPKPPNAWSP
jgi:class 3 adenylate cyclase